MTQTQHIYTERRWSAVGDHIPVAGTLLMGCNEPLFLDPVVRPPLPPTPCTGGVIS
jgi:hypothetical protein